MRSKQREPKSTGPAPIQATASGAVDAFRHSLHGIAVENPVTNLIQDCNPAFARLVGLMVEEVIDKQILDFYAAGIHPHVRQQVASADRDGQVLYEAQMCHTDGTVFPVEVGLVSVKGAGDTVTSRIVSVRHIGGHKKAEPAKQESEAQYRMIAESTGDIIWLFDLKADRFTFVSPSVEKIRGYTPKEIHTQSLRDALTEASYRKATELLQLRISEVEAGDVTNRIETNIFDQLHKNGSIVPTEIVTTLLCDEAGRVSQILGVSRDISERLREEAARKASEQRFAKTFHASPTAMSLTRLADGRIEDVNEAFLRLFGYARTEVIGQRTLQLGLWATPLDRERLHAALCERPTLPECEIRIRRKSGELGWILISAEIFEEEGCKYVISMVTDITERRRTETVIAIQHELAQSLAKVSDLGLGLNLCLNAAIQASGADVGGLYLLNPSTGSLDLEVHRGLSPQFILEATHYEADSELTRLVARGRAIFSTHGEAGSILPGIARREGLRFIGIIPLHSEGRLIGCLNVASHVLEGIPPSARSALETVAAGAAQAIARLTTEAALRHESLRLASIIESTHAATWEWNIQTGATVFNETWASLIGYSLAELEPTSLQTWMKLSHPEDIRRTTELLQRHFTGELPYYQNESRMRHKDGHWIWVLDRGRVVSRTPAGEPLSMLGTHTDISSIKNTELALRESEHRLRLFVKHAPVALAMFDREMRYVEYSQRWAEDFALTQPDLRGLSHYVIFPEITETWRAINRRALAGEVVRAEEDRFVRADGSVQWLRWEVRPWQGNDTGGIVIFSEDITARKEAEAAVRDHEARYRSLVESTSDWIWEMDTACRYTYASPRVEALLGYKPEEVIGQSAFDFMPPGEVTRIRDLFNRLAASHEPISGLENINRHKDGRLVIMETNGMPVFSADGTWLGYRGMDRDITDRRAAEQTLRLHGAALEAAANAIVITSFNGTIEWANPAFTRASGWTREEAIGQNPRALINSGQHGAAYFRRMWMTINSGMVWQGEIVNRRKDGTLHTEDMTITPLLNAQGTISHFIAIKQDITERKQLEANNRQIQRLESIGTLAGGIAHDLNNILTPIIIGCNMVLDTTKNAGDREILTMMRDGAQRGAGIIGQLLTFSRGAEGQRVPVQPRHVLKEVGHIMRETFPREIEVVIDHADNLPSIEADPTQLHQLILNLCVNARDAMPEGGRLTLRGYKTDLTDGDPRLPPGAPAGSYIRIDVSDTGNGIPPEIRHRIFDPFFTTKPVGKGTGLGLSSVMGIVRSHDGIVTVDSELGSGTTFKVYLPAEAEERIARTPAAVPVAARGDGKLILVVDDERSIREANRLVLQRHGYRVVLACDGREALAQYHQHRGELALVLTDVMMPIMNGAVLIRELRNAGVGIPVIATTGMSESSRKDELAELGIDSFLMKPYTTDDLLQVIGRKLAPPSAKPL